MTNINDKKFIWTTVASILIILGMLKIPIFNKHSTSTNSNRLKTLGMLLLGLSIATKITGSIFNLDNNGHAILAMFGTGLVIVSSSHMNSCNEHCPPHTIAGYAGGLSLLALALAVQSKFNWINSTLAFGAILAIIYSKLRLQTKHIAYTISTSALFGLVLANSIQ